MSLSRLIIRNYREEDLPGVLALYDSVSNRSLHFVRDEPFLRYFTHCGGSGGDNIFVALEEERIIGLAVVSITDEGELRQGNIIELQAEDTLSMKSLVRAALDYCNRKDVDMIAVVPPAHIKTEDIFTDWLKVEPNVMMCKPLTILPLMPALLDRKEIKSSYARKTIVFHIDEEIIEVKITPELVSVTNLDNYPDDKLVIFVTMSAKVFFELVMSITNRYVAYFTRRVRIRGLKNIATILGLLGRMKLDMPLYVSLGDRM